MRPLWMALAFAGLAACSQEEMLQRFSSPEDQAVARAYIEQLRARKFDEIEKAMDPGLRAPHIRGTLTKMADLMPNREPTSVKLVGAHRFSESDVATVDTTFEYGFGDAWLLIHVAIRQKNGEKTIVGFNVNTMPRSLEEQNRFSLAGKSAIHYAVLAAAVASVLVSLYALAACVRTPRFRRKWLWVLFTLVGVGKVGVNWTTGAWGFAPLSVQFISAGAYAPLFGPWTVAVSLPLGALLFLLYKRPSLAKTGS
jgi:hypothetical protein